MVRGKRGRPTPRNALMGLFLPTSSSHLKPRLYLSLVHEDPSSTKHNFFFFFKVFDSKPIRIDRELLVKCQTQGSIFSYVDFS